MFQLSAEHEAVLVLVVQLQALEEVLVAALVLLLLDLGEDGQELLDGQLLLAPLLGGAHLLAQRQGRVEVQGAQHIADLAGVDLALTLHVEDGESELSPWKGSSSSSARSVTFTLHGQGWLRVDGWQVE